MLTLGVAAFAGKEVPEVLVDAAPTTMHPLYAWTDDDRRLHALVHESLFERDAHGTWRSDVVAETARDGASVRLGLVKGRTWSDGAPVVAADVCATIDRIRSTGRPTPFTAATLARVSACAVDPQDPLVAVVTLAGPEAEPRAALALPLVPAHRPEWTHAGPRSELAPVSAGPWRLGRDGRLDGPTRLQWTVVDDPVGVFVGGRGAEVRVPPARLAEVRSVPGVTLGVEAPVVWALFVNPTRLPDPRVRWALDLSIDRARLGAAVLGADPGRPFTSLSGPFPPGTPGHSAGVPVPLPDRDRARALLAEAGVPDGLALTIAVPAGRAPPGFVEALRAELEGIAALEERPLDPEQWWFSLEAGGHAGTTDLALVPLPPGEPGPWLHTRTDRAGWANPFGFSDPTVDALLERLAAGDSAAGEELHGVLADLRPALWLWASADRIARRAR